MVTRVGGVGLVEPLARGHKYSVLLPTYNERENIGLIVFLIVETFENIGAEFEVIVIDDASPDGTQEAVIQLQKIYGEHRILLKPRAGKLGLGTAYTYGLSFASGDYVVLMDADLSHHPKYLPAMIVTAQRTGADVVTGTRYGRGGGVHGWNAKRKLISRGANLLAQTLLAPRVSDVTGSFRLYKATAIRRLMSGVRSKGYVFQMEIMVRARRMGLSVVEVPITFVDRVYGASKLGAGEITAYVKGLVQLLLTT